MRKTMEAMDAKELQKKQEEIFKFMFGFVDSMALKCAIELRIADIINSHSAPITLPQIASHINSSTTDIMYLERIMRLLVHRNIFSASKELEPRYALTHLSRWILRDSEPSLAPMILMENDQCLMAPWHCLSQCVKEGGIAFKRAHGVEIWELASQDHDFNKLFNDGMASTAKMVMDAIISGYKDGFGSIGSLIDVGGGTGQMVAEIVRVYPHIKGINFDLSHVVQTAPNYYGVSHVGGNMFEAIPNADVVFMKHIMHDWSDEDCVKILKNCRKAIPEKNGKIVIADMVLKTDENGVVIDEIGIIFDLLMIAHSSGGKERTEFQWKNILIQSGFPKYNIIKIPSLISILEAYPQ